MAAVFSLLTTWPEAPSYKDRMFCRCLCLVADALIKMRESSTKKRWLTRGAPWQILRPSFSPFLSALCIKAEKPSTQIINRCGDNGSPCRNPLGFMVSVYSQFTLILNET